MELTFDKATGICEFEVTADFNLHLERESAGTLHIYQRTAGREYTFVDDQGYLSAKEVIDYDFQSLVYPKFIKIKSSVLPTVAIITTDGEVNELKYQSKSVKIESNGTVSVTPDAGYNGLSEVSVEVDVPTEGGGK